MSYKTETSINYCTRFAEYVTSQVQEQGWQISDNPYQHYYVDAVFAFPRSNMDCNNYWKVLLDAITDTQLVWHNDNVVCERVKKIIYDAQDPRIELTIHPVEYIGIFDNAQQLDDFMSANCADCTRHNNNCSILQKAMHGKVQPEVADLACSKRRQRKKRRDKKDVKEDND